MELTRFMQALARRSGKLDGIDMGVLLALLFLDERTGPIRGSRANQLRFHLELLDIRLAESDAPDELLVVWEAAQLSLPEAAARLAGDDPAVAQLAEKVRTRKDVEWLRRVAAKL